MPKNTSKTKKNNGTNFDLTTDWALTFQKKFFYLLQ